MDRIKVYIQSSIIPLTEVSPVVSGDFEYTKEKDKIYYKHESKDSFKFDKKADWDLLQPQIADECGEVTVTVEKLCKGTYSLYWTGVFSIFDSTINYDRCFLEVKPKPLDEYKCFEDGLKEEQNIFSSGTVVTVTAIGGILEEQVCQNFNFNADCNDYFNAINTPLDDCLTDPTQWCLKSNVVLFNGQDVGYNCNSSGGTDEVGQTTTWHREVATVDCVGGVATPPAFGTGWQLLADDCSGSNTSTWWRCPPNTNGLVVGDYTRGRTLDGVLTKIMSNMGCGLTIKSDFYNINPVGDAPSNGAYAYAATNLQNITIHQQSDIKRKNANSGSSSTAWEIKAKDFFEDLQKIHNVWYIIQDGVLILEHYSFFTTTLGWDLSNVATPLKVDYSGNENVRTEKFYWREENSSYAFKSQTILYDCGEEDKEVRCKLFNTDIAYIENPDNEDKINDEGFVMIANAPHNGNLIIIDNNNPLKWTQLQPNLHPYARLYKSGKINNVQQNFISWLPYIKQDKFKVDLCCDQVFKPQDLITTRLGSGVVGSATHNILTDRLETELSY